MGLILAILAAFLVLHQLSGWAFSGARERLRLAPTPQAHPLASNDVPRAVDAAFPMPFVIERGQTLGGVLSDLGMPAREQAGAVAALAEHLSVRRLAPGIAGLAYADHDGRIEGLRMRTGAGWLELARTGGGWGSTLRDFIRRTEVSRIEGLVDGPLEQAVRAAGGAPEIAYKMAFVLRWDLDFNRDLRRGDRFQVLFEHVFLDDSDTGPGAVLALAYENRGRRFEAYRFDHAYYDGEGRPLQKMFLRSPLPFSRVTSRFSKSRFHPVLKVRRPHWGVDYGAPTGTPVRATAGGTVSFAGRKGGAGNMVELRHVAGYRSAYLHLSRFAKGMRAGRRVAQGEVIGYVGSTGLATAPHLDYRVKKNGRWIDPLSLQRTPSEPIPAARRPLFQARRDALRRQLETGSGSGSGEGKASVSGRGRRAQRQPGAETADATARPTTAR